MSNQFYHLLTQWHVRRKECQWVLGAVIRTSGSVYRKAGALMLLSETGDQLGLLSGGCLENDLLLQARKVIALKKSRRVVYDASDEGSLAWALGIGCGGVAEIALHPCNSGNDHLKLEQVLNLLQKQQACRYQVSVDNPEAECVRSEKAFNFRQHGELCVGSKGEWLTTLINPPPHLLILGKGPDMIPLCQLACAMGWRTSVADARLGATERARFPTGVNFYQTSAAELDRQVMQQIDAVVVAHHNLRLDAAALVALRRWRPLYIGLLGPAKRKQEVLALAGLEEGDMPTPVAGPMGLALGGDLPESVALSVLAECHAVIHGSGADALSGAYSVQAVTV